MPAPKQFIIPNSVKAVNRKLYSSGFPEMSLRDAQLAANYLARSANVLNSSLVGWWDATYGVTQSSNLVSRWRNLTSNNASFSADLIQATAASRPRYLGWEGTNYLWLPGVAGNYASTPDSAVLDIQTDITLVWFGAATTWTSGGAQYLVAKRTSTNQISYSLALQTNGTLQARFSSNGAINASELATSSIPVPFIPQAFGGCAVTRAGTVVKFWTSTDGSTWTQLGSDQTISLSGNIFQSTSIASVGSDGEGIAPLSGSTRQAAIYSGIPASFGGAGGTLVFNANFTSVPNGATSFTESSSNGATVTINSSGALPAQIVGASSMIFDGTDDFMRTPPFPLNQPETVYLVGKAISYTSTDTIYDGNTINSMRNRQVGISPTFGLLAPTTGLNSSDLAIGSIGVITAVFNSSSSSLRVNRVTAATGDVGTSGAGGFALAAAGDNTLFGNIQVYAVLVFNQAHSTATQNIIIQYLGEKWGIAV